MEKKKSNNKDKGTLNKWLDLSSTSQYQLVRWGLHPTYML